MRKSSFLFYAKKLYGQEVYDYLISNNDKTITWDLYIKSQITSKQIYVKFQCILCYNSERLACTTLNSRESCKDAVCKKCCLKSVTNSDEWKEKNSIAQKKIQSTPEQKLKNSQAVSKFWEENPEVKLQMIKTQKMRMQEPEIKTKWLNSIRNNPSRNALAGYYTFKSGKRLFFGSSYELCFLVYCDNSEKYQHIRRCEFDIPYIHDNKTKHYLPDYYLVDNSNTKILVEIKSSKHTFFDLEKEKSKKVAVLKMIENKIFDQYEFIDEEHILAKEIVFKKSSGIYKLCKKLFSEKKLEFLNLEKQKRYVGI